MSEISVEAIKEEIKKDFSKKEWLILTKNMFFPNKKRVLLLIIFIFCFDNFFVKNMLVPIFLKNELKTFIENFITNSQTVFLTLFGIIIMGYTVYQTLLNNEFVFILAATPAKEKGLEKRSRFTVASNYFYAFCIMTLSLIIFNLISLSVIKNDKVLKILINNYKNILENKVLIRIVLAFYMYISLNTIFEIKSFLKTLFDSIKIDAFISKIDKI
ncbi:hypothetical protein [Fusobacterium sp.]|uniref:hypothetical protein n=1 Tax=Fusobacterium sp. TaxID=68766 RepID=UPI002613AC50|nr:hypothetical protein [Fusobacterium sp.]